jgi:cysteine desulfurase family protein (TIGR01976 family)
MPAAPSLDRIRARFPALSGPLALLENAGGSQVPDVVADAIRRYMLESYVQLGAGYPMSDAATKNVADAHRLVSTVMNADRAGTVILGASTTQLCHLIANAMRDSIRPGDEIVLAETGHEANIGPWLTLAKAGAVIRWWKVDRDVQDCPLGSLDALLSPRTRLVAFPHVSNLLGGIVDVAAVTRKAHAAGARVFVDGVAFAPHRAIDVEGWGVDWYVYSTYKVFGPHMAALFGRHDALAELEGPNHFFIPHDDLPYKFELGGSSHEGCAAINALGPYLAFLAGKPESTPLDRPTVEAAFARMTELELPLQERLVDGLRRLPHLHLVGPAATAADARVPTVSFIHARLAPTEVVRRLHAAGLAVRNGHMYAYRLCEALGIDVTEGVVRVSAVHYNTPDEVERMVAALAAMA